MSLAGLSPAPRRRGRGRGAGPGAGLPAGGVLVHSLLGRRGAVGAVGGWLLATAGIVAVLLAAGAAVADLLAVAAAARWRSH